MKNNKNASKIEFRGYVLLLIFGILQISCSVPPKPSTTWDRYQKINFNEVLTQFKGYLDFTEENTMRIFSPANAFRGFFSSTGKYSEISEEEIMVLLGKFQNEMTEQQVRQTYKHKALLKTENEDGWFCFQEPIFPDLKALKPGTPISVLYQFAGSTNSHNNPRLIFAALGWSE